MKILFVLFYSISSHLFSDVYWRTPIIGLDNLLNNKPINIDSSNINVGKTTVYLAKQMDKKGLILDEKNYLAYLDTLDFYAKSLFSSNKKLLIGKKSS